MRFSSVVLALFTVAAAAAPARAQTSSGGGTITGLAALPAGATVTVISGVPATGPSTIALAVPAGYAISAHRHPTDESVTVTNGTYVITTGTAPATTTHTLATGQSFVIPANTAHTEHAVGPTTVRVTSPGAFAITYVSSLSGP